MVFWPLYQWYIEPPIHGMLSHMHVIWPFYPWNSESPTLGMSTPDQWYFDPLCIVFWPATHSISNPLPMIYRPHSWYFDHLIHVSLTLDPWYFELSIQKMFTPILDIVTIPIVYRPPRHGIFTPSMYGISTPLPMVYRTPYPWYVDPYAWYFDSPTNAISNCLPMICRPLSMLCWPPYSWFIELAIHRI